MAIIATRGGVGYEVDPVTGRIRKADASGRDILSDLNVDHFAGVCAGAIMVDWADASIGTPTSGWTIAKDTSKTFAGKTSLRVTATAGAADTLVCAITVPSVFFGGAKRLCFATSPGDSYIAGDGNNPVQLWLNYSASTTHRLMSYAYQNHKNGGWVEGTCFDQDTVGAGHITGTAQWAKVVSENVTTIQLVMTKRAGQAIDTPLYVGSVYTDPVERTKPTLTIFMDGQYSGQYNYARQILQAYGLRASLAFVANWFTDYPTVGGGAYPGTMTEAQILKMYALGHEIIHHTGLGGPTGNENVGWDNTSKYPDGSEYSLVKADISASQNWLTQRGCTRGLGYGVVGFTNGLANTQTMARRANISNALIDSGMKKIRQLGAYYGSYYGAARESCLVIPQSRMVQAIDSTATITGIIDQIIARGGWSGLTFHDIALSGATGNNYNVADLETVLDYVAGKVSVGTLRVLPFSEAMSELEFVNLPA